MEKLAAKQMTTEIVEGIFQYLDHKDRKNLSMVSLEILRFCEQSASFRDQNNRLQPIIGKLIFISFDSLSCLAHFHDTEIRVWMFICMIISLA